MSDAKAKAEARRAKILAREGDRLSLAKGEKSSLKDGGETLAEPVAELDSVQKSSERPLAARRSFVKKAVVSESDDVKPSTSDEKVIPESATPDSDEKPEKPAVVSAEDPDNKSVPAVMIPDIVRRVEMEVAKNTAEFDATMTDKKGLARKSSASSKKTPIIIPLQASQVMRLIRLLSTVVFGIVAGYLTVTTAPVNSFDYRSIVGSIDLSEEFNSDLQSHKMLSSFLTSNPVGGEFVESASVATSSSLLSSPIGVAAVGDDSSVEQNWTKWVLDCIQSQLTCTVTAVALMWWLTSQIQPWIQLKFPVKQPKGGNLLSYLFSLYNDGLEVLLEMGLGVIGEISLHFFLLACSVILMSTLADYFITVPNNISGSSSSSGPESRSEF